MGLLLACICHELRQAPPPSITRPDTHLPLSAYFFSVAARDVCPTMACPFTKIRDAVMASGPGDIVRVAGGNYQENMTIPTASITIELITSTPVFIDVTVIFILYVLLFHVIVWGCGVLTCN